MTNSIRLAGLTSAFILFCGLVYAEAIRGKVVDQTLEEVKAAGALRSSYRKQVPRIKTNEVPQANLKVFRNEIAPVLKRSCVQCHGPETQEGEFRVDTLDPDLLHGEDVNWWLEVVDVLSNGEMPPADEAKLADEDRSKVIDWLSSEIQVASAVRRAEQGHSSFRRMTRYEYNYALQDLLGLPYNFAQDLPPDPTSEDGFQNSSEMLQMSAMQFGYYRELSRSALKKATVRGERPDPIYWNFGMEDAMAKMYILHEQELEGLKRRLKDRPEILKQQLERLDGRFLVKPGVAHFKNLSTGQTTQASWRHFGGKYALKPTETRREAPENPQHVAIIPANGRFVVELGNRVPDTGMLRIRIRASRTSVAEDGVPSLRLEFGWQASNNSSASVRVSDRDIAINAPPGKPQFYEWDIPLSEIYPRNPLRATAEMGKTPSPSEYLRLQNSSLSQGDIQIDFIEITAPVYDQWPPKSHTGIFVDSANKANETEYAREVLEQFMSRAWRRSITAAEIDQKVALFARFRPKCEDFQEAMLEVLATVLSSPKFLYLIQSDQGNESEGSGDRARLTDFELATRLSMFLWCSLPDEELLQLAADERLSDPDVLISQTNRMLTDARSRRFSKNFVRQWLGMQLLDFLDVDKKTFPQFNNDLKEAMQDEPVAFFREVLQKNDSVIDFLHADYTMANERLARHYGLRDVYGNHMRKVTLKPEDRRGGLLTQAGLLAMNSDGKDSHPLKRGIWLLESLLNDPPPPPPPAVPEIDLADPEIAKMTLKQRLEDHRNHAACNSCHAKIDPWGIAFENYDALGRWRDRVNGKPVDATSVLFNNQQLDGMDGLKRFLLKNRQDQFVRAMVYKMTTFALGRPLTFADHSSIDRITADVRQQGDGLATLVRLVATSKLFRSK
jgi:mono/diheme cytochrome c family protein